MSQQGLRVAVIAVSVAEAEALQACVAAIPKRGGVAWIVVPLIAPGPGDDLMAGLQAPVPVVAALDGAALIADQVVVVPPGWLMRVQAGRLWLERGRARDTVWSAVELCLTTLAEEVAPVAVLLSGRWTDGLTGLRAVRDAGGAVLMAAEQAPEHGPEGMSGLIDRLVPAASAAPEAARLCATPAVAATIDTDAAAQVLGLAVRPDADGAARLAARVRRRMRLMQVRGVDAYLAQLRRDPVERAMLARDVMQAEARFFPSAQSLESLRDRVLIPLLQSDQESFRLWVPGCGTGELTYSLAMLIAELTAAQGDARRWRLFGSDTDAVALRQARVGVFPRSALTGVSAPRQDRFFTEARGGYEIDGALREMCVFSQHNLYVDPPFGHLDLILCRNPLMFAGQAEVSQALSVFHYALQPGGCLGVLDAPDATLDAQLFEPLDERQTLFRRRAGRRGAKRVLDRARPRAEQSLVSGAALAREAVVDWPSERAGAEHAVLQLIGAAFASLDDTGRLLHCSPAMQAFLSAVRSDQALTLRDLQSFALAGAAEAALAEVRDRGVASVVSDVMAEVSGEAQVVNLRVQPFEDRRDRYLLVLGKVDALGTDPSQAVQQEASDATGFWARIRRLEHRSADAEKALSNANHELMAMNEALQDSNKQLAISREELEFINGKLQDYNRDLSSTAERLAHQNAELQAIYEGVPIGLGLINREFAWVRSNRSMAKMMGLPPETLEGALAELSPTALRTGLEQPVRAVLEGEPARTGVEIHLDAGGAGAGRVLMGDIFPVRLKDEVTAAGVAVRDVTRARALATEKDMLLAELEHRVKNMMAVVRAVTRFTAQTAKDKDTMVSSLSQRLYSIGRTHELLVRSGWKAQGLRVLAESSLAPFVGPGADNFRYEGPEVFLQPTEAQAIGLALHELGTNAVKHGALSTPTGRVTLTVTARQGHFSRIVWQETGGPDVKPPKDSGFGTYLMKTILGRQLLAEVELDYAQGGVRVTIQRKDREDS
ncbi:CheR family methyltransferase [Antarctobacter jejuensis]|uniref:CheR family methyltransferase n=1 Tax=Antarctobacter jejuensis TaxID=1439938 RepID=UPI003FD38171